jgi:hypothetical protein
MTPIEQSQHWTLAQWRHVATEHGYAVGWMGEDGVRTVQAGTVMVANADTGWTQVVVGQCQ